VQQKISIISSSQVSLVASGSGNISCDEDLMFSDLPNQPLSTECFPAQVLSKRTLVFQPSWYQKYPWLHYSPSSKTKGVLCFFCAKAANLKLLELSSKSDDAFISRGFCNWKHAINKFQAHEKSSVHAHAVNQVAQRKALPIESQLSSQKQKEQRNCRIALVKLFTSIRFLARQGLAFRGNQTQSGNYNELLKLRCQDDSELRTFMAKTTVTKFISPESQNEMLSMLQHNILRSLTQHIKEESKQYSIIVDGTQDCTGAEQESICIRYICHDLEPAEVFLGLYQPPDTKGSTIASIVEDALVRLDLSLNDLRGQAYDGAANMAGEYNGCQAIVSRKQPLALHFHCGAHCSNLVMQAAAVACPLVRDAIQWTHELGVLASRSGKFKHMLSSAATDLTGNFLTIKPLCPTRWLCRRAALQRVLEQYEAVLDGLESISQMQNASETSIKARGLLVQFQEGTTLLGIKIASDIIGILEELNTSLQATNATVSGMLQAVKTVEAQLSQFRSEEKFHQIFTSVNDTITQLDLKPVSLPRQRRPPRRLSGPAVAYEAPTAEIHYRTEYLAFVDTAIGQLQTRFNPHSPGIATYLVLEQILISGQTCSDNGMLKNYPELDTGRLAIQLEMFKMQFKYNTLADAKNILQSMLPEVRLMFSEVEQLVRLLLLCPASSCEAERSFSSLRRLKTWLRNSMTQERLNSVIVCHVHQDILDSLDLHKIAADFAGRSDIRKSLFGNGPF
jgi:hypothetical protein